MKRSRSVDLEDASTLKNITAPINQLPEELLLQILSYVPWKQKLLCLTVCRSWNKTMTATALLWCSTPYLCATLQVLEARWPVLRRLTKSGKIRTMELRILDLIKLRDGFSQRWHDSIVRNFFPYDTLQKFHYNGLDMTIDGLVWTTITRCTQLRVLKWESYSEGYHSQTRSDNDIPQERSSNDMYLIGGTSLAACKLETFFIQVNSPLVFDDAYVGMLSEVKHLHIKQSLDWQRVTTILEAAKDSVEDLLLTKYKKAQSGEINVVELPKLYKYTAYWHPIGDDMISSRGPIIKSKCLTSLLFKESKMIDWDLVEANRDRLKRLHVNTYKEKMEPRIEQELFNMPQLVDLDHRYGDGCGGDNDTDSPCWKTFWSAIENGFTGKPYIEMKQILPKLKKLTLFDDPIMTPKLMIKFLETRRELGLPAIENLAIFCSDVNPFKKGDKRRIKGLVGHLWIEDNDEWNIGHELTSDDDLFIN